MPVAFAAFGEHERELLFVVQQPVRVVRVRGYAADRATTACRRPAARGTGTRPCRTPGGRASVSMPCMIAGASDGIAPAWFDDEQRAAGSRAAVRSLATRRGTSTGRSGRRARRVEAAEVLAASPVVDVGAARGVASGVGVRASADRDRGSCRYQLAPPSDDDRRQVGHRLLGRLRHGARKPASVIRAQAVRYAPRPVTSQASLR